MNAQTWISRWGCLIVLVLMGCSGHGSSTPAPAISLPTISRFTATPASLAPGQSSTLSWAVSGATSLSIDSNVGTVTGTSTVVSPTVTTTYTLTATNASGSATAPTTVTVTAATGKPAITYSPSSLMAVVGTLITPLTPANTGGAAASWAIAPTLPAGLSLNPTTGQISGTPTAVSASTLYTVTATNAAGNGTATLTLAVTLPSTQKAATVYESGLVAPWLGTSWNNVTLNAAAAVPAGHSGSAAFEATLNAGWTAAGFGQPYDGSANPPRLNEARTLEFDIYFQPGTGDAGALTFILNDAGLSDEPTLTSFIPGWAGLSAAQRYGHWFHINIDLASIHPKRDDISGFLLFNNSGTGGLRMDLASVKIDYVDRTTPPVISVGAPTLSPAYDQLTLPFTTDEAVLYHVDYGVGSYGHTVSGPTDYSQPQSVLLTGLNAGTTVQYRITATDHRMDSTATPNQATATGTYVIPAAPTAPPVISGLAASGITGNKATLGWTTNRPCTAVVTYQRNGGATLTRKVPTLSSAPSLGLDLLEPSQTYSVSLTVTDAFALSATATTTFTTGATATPTITITVNPAVTRPISPYIYGSNFYDALANKPRDLTLNRAGGNRWTAYNWENNASNAGSDYLYESDAYLGGGTTPGESIRSFIAASQALNTASLITLQLQGYVAADKSGPVATPFPNLSRFKPVVFKKGSAFTAAPSTTDGSVYMDELTWALQGKFTADIFAANTSLPTFISLDNEPDLWNSTHQEIQGSLLPVATTFNNRSAQLAQAIKDVAPEAKVFGPVVSGFMGLWSLGGLPGYDLASSWFTDQYLTDMKNASNAYGHRLLDAFDFHWYPEARSLDTNKRVTGMRSATLTDGEVQAIVQAPRSLWDHAYKENSWIANDTLVGPIYILDRLQAKVDATYPGTALALTEYDPGGAHHIAGALAQADNLGIFGAKGLYAATFWDEPTNANGDTGSPFILAGFKMYRDFDGNHGAFGDISLAATSSDTSKVSAYVSHDSIHPGRTVIVVINRSSAAQDVAFTGLSEQGTATVYRLDATADPNQPSPAAIGQMPAVLASWVINLPAYSVSTIVLTP